MKYVLIIVSFCDLQNNVDTKAIDIISLVGCSVSLLCLLLTVIAHISLWR